MQFQECKLEGTSIMVRSSAGEMVGTRSKAATDDYDDECVILARTVMEDPSVRLSRAFHRKWPSQTIASRCLPGVNA